MAASRSTDRTRLSSSPSPGPSSSGGNAAASFFRQLNGSGMLLSPSNPSPPGEGSGTQSGFLDRFRRPRTAVNLRDERSTSPSSTDYGAASSDDVTTRNTSRNSGNGGSRLRFVSRVAATGLPRSSSSSHVANLPSPDREQARGGTSSPLRRPAMPSHSASQSQGNFRLSTDEQRGRHGAGVAAVSDGGLLGFPSMTRSGSAQSNSGGSGGGGSNGGGGGGGLSRILRRYSQGPGRTMSNAREAQAGDAALHTSATASSSGAAGGTSSASHLQAPRASSRRQSPLLPATAADTASSNNAISPPAAADSAGDTTGAQGTLASMATATQLSSMDGARDEAVPPASSRVVENDRERPPQQQTAVHRIRLVPNLEATRSLHFEPIERDLVQGASPIRIGRFTDRALQQQQQQGGDVGSTSDGMMADGGPNGGSIFAASSGAGSARPQGIPGARGGAVPSSSGGAARIDSTRIAFKSKVVSRGHAEVWCDEGGKFFIRDTKSSSGTFLNHIRLSNPNAESRPHQVRDGDVVQLGVDYQGGTEEIYRCVKMRVELNRGWQRGANEYNINALRQLEALRGNHAAFSPPAGDAAGSSLPTNREALSVTDCCICLYSVSVCQALFIAPCSHVYHYKCIRPLINRHFPGFQCPLCRTFADLEAEVERDDAWQEELIRAEAISRLDASRAALNSTTPSEELVMPSLAAAAHQAARANDVGTPAAFEARLDNHANDATVTMANESEEAAVDVDSDLPLTDNIEILEDRAVPSEGDVSSSSPRSAPINVRRQQQHFTLDRFDASPGQVDARTPQNEHFLSTLAEAPPPPLSALRAMGGTDEAAEHRGSVGDVFSTPLQGNSPRREPSTLDAVMAAGDAVDGHSAQARPTPFLAEQLTDRKSSASGSVENAVVPSLRVPTVATAREAVSKGKAPEVTSASASPRLPSTTAATADRSNGDAELWQPNGRRASMRSDQTGSGDSSRDTHRTGNSNSNSNSHSSNGGSSGSAVGSGRVTNAVAPTASGDTASPGSTSKMSRFFKRASSAVQN